MIVNTMNISRDILLIDSKPNEFSIKTYKFTYSLYNNLFKCSLFLFKCSHLMVLETGRGRGGSKTTENKNLKTVFFSAVMLVGWPLFRDDFMYLGMSGFVM